MQTMSDERFTPPCEPSWWKLYKGGTGLTKHCFIRAKAKTAYEAKLKCGFDPQRQGLKCQLMVEQDDTQTSRTTSDERWEKSLGLSASTTKPDKPLSPLEEAAALLALALSELDQSDTDWEEEGALTSLPSAPHMDVQSSLKSRPGAGGSKTTSECSSGSSSDSEQCSLQSARSKKRWMSSKR